MVLILLESYKIKFWTKIFLLKTIFSAKNNEFYKLKLKNRRLKMIQEKRHFKNYFRAKNTAFEFRAVLA